MSEGIMRSEGIYGRPWCWSVARGRQVELEGQRRRCRTRRRPGFSGKRRLSCAHNLGTVFISPIKLSWYMFNLQRSEYFSNIISRLLLGVIAPNKIILFCVPYSFHFVRTSFNGQCTAWMQLKEQCFFFANCSLTLLLIDRKIGCIQFLSNFCCAQSH